MSHDGSYILIRGGEPRYFYSRWGGLTVDRDLLRGPDPFVDWVAELSEVQRAWCEPWICGLVIVDLDRREVDYWANQFAGNNACDQRAHRALMAHRWRGFTPRWLFEPARALTERLREPPVVPTSVVDDSVPSLDDFLTRQEHAWQSVVEDPASGWEEDVGKHGEIAVRSWYEHGTHASWVCVRRADGSTEDTLLDDHEGDLLRLGPAALRALEPRPSGLPDGITPYRERDVDWCFFVDETPRRLLWWSARPRFSAQLPSEIATAWSGFEVATLEDGPMDVLRELGLDARTFSHEGERECRLGTWRRLLGARPTGAGILARVASTIAVEPDQKVVITHPGRGDAGPAADDGEWKAECWKILGPLLSEP